MIFLPRPHDGVSFPIGLTIPSIQYAGIFEAQLFQWTKKVK